MEFNHKNEKNLLIIVIAGILLYEGIQNLSGIIGLILWIIRLLYPFIIGGAIAFIFNVPMKQIEHNFYEKIFKIKASAFRRVISYITTLFAVVCVLLIVILVIVPELVNTCNSLIKQAPYAYDSTKDYIQTQFEQWPQLSQLVNQGIIDLNAITQNGVKLLQNEGMVFLNSTVGIVGGFLSGIVTFFIAFTFSVYILLQKEKLGSHIKKILYAILPVKRVDSIIYVGKLSNSIFSNFLSGQCLEAVILGTMFFITLTIFKLPYAIIIGMLIAVTALIPIFGAFVGLFVGTFLILMVDPVQALEFIIIFFVLQQIEGNLIYPHVVGGSVGLPSIWVLVVVTIGGNLMGIVGMLLFIPLSSVAYALFREFVYKRLAIRNISPSKWRILGESIEDNEAEDSNNHKDQKRKNQNSENQIHKD